MASLDRIVPISAFIFVTLNLLAHAQIYQGRARLFIADNVPQNPSIAVVDLPSYNLTQRIQLPGTALQLGVSQDYSHIGVFRNRDNQQQFFSMLSTGIIPVLPAAGARLPAPPPLQDSQDGNMRAAVLAKSIIFVNGSDGIGGVDSGGSLVYHQGWRLYISYAENHGRIHTYRTDDLNSVNAFRPASIFYLPVGQFQVVPYGNFIVAPHTGANSAYILSSNGTIVRRYGCAACVSAATYIAFQSMTAVFSCNDTVLVVRNTSANGTYLPVSSPRVSSFVDGAPGVFWSSDSSQRFFWRTDVRASIPRVSRNVTHRGGILRMLSLPSRGRFIAIHNDGYLVMYDGESGAPLTSILVRAGGFPSNQTAPFLKTDIPGKHVFVSVPALGVVHVIHVEHGGHEDHSHAPGEPEDEPDQLNMEFERTVTVGGMPTAMTIAYMPGVEYYSPH